MKKLIVVILLTLFSLPVFATEYTFLDDYLQILNKDALSKTFGKQHLKDGVAYYDEGNEKRNTTVLVHPKSKQVIKFVWDANFNTAWIEAEWGVGANATVPTVSTRAGLSTGMSLAQLRAWNQADFQFYGFEWAHEGTLGENKGSKIARQPARIKLFYSDESVGVKLLGSSLISSDAVKTNQDAIFISLLTMHVPSKGFYTVQAGAFKSQPNALALKAALSKNRADVFILLDEKSNTYRVCIGKFSDRNQATAAQSDVRSQTVATGAFVRRI